MAEGTQPVIASPGPVTVAPPQTKGSKRWMWLLLGAAAAGGTAAVVTGGGDDAGPDTGDLTIKVEVP